MIRQFPNDSYNKNLGDAEVIGAEFEFSMSLTEGLFWRFGGDVKDTEVQEGALAGNQLVFAPEYSINTGLDYTFGLTDGMDMTLHGDVSWVGEQYANGANDDNRLIPAYHMANARVVLNSTSETSWNAALWVRNLTNEANLTNISHLRQDYFYSPPRSIGVEFGWQY
ncbi:TonB-dependent receptor domain-containing protein [Luminiphilus syltensis]|uniref:TonB-dependent receptor domain-containing protein n=1 Tax=Luminiphilus syltensis TaxID=1341119 RepID=UPI00058FECAA|nr:TonB-dependent receptor [Luminiphilus syltensis]